MFFALCLALFSPLLGFFFLFFFYQKLSRSQTNLVACGSVFFSFLCFIICLFFYERSGKISHDFLFYSWITIQKVNANFTLHLDSLSLLMTFIITGVGFLIHLYSTGYMDKEKDYVRYFACLNLFIFAMLLLVLAGDLLLLFVGWEAVGLASYLLIGFWYKRPSAAQAATKAFVINRIGDLGLLTGILLTFFLFETTEIATISKLANQQFAKGAFVITLLTLLYFIGAIGKSAQLPLYTWLPDAMEGPTPVSALIHAATMVTAGVYLLARMNEVFLLAPFTLQIVGGVGALTALFASVCALAQTDLKKVLAYSTVSQLGLMFLACGAGAFYSALFHLTTHAFVKALLFLSAGSVLHALHGTTEMAKMGGLKQVLPQTDRFFLIGSLALAGLPPLAPFFSKDLILEQEQKAGFTFLFYIGLIASLLTGFYLIRAYCLTFKGASYLNQEELKNVQEAPFTMLIPLSILTLLTAGGGLLGFTFYQKPFLQAFLSPFILLTQAEQELKSGFIFNFETALALGGSLVSLAAAAWLYTSQLSHLRPTKQLIKKSFFINELYWTALAVPLKTAASFVAFILEPKIFDQSIDKISYLVQKVAQRLQCMQSGQIRSYVAWMVLGAAALLIFLAF